MADSESSRAAETGAAGYRFAGVVLDLRRGCLWVDGSEVPTTPQLLRLLQVLCESGGRLLRRQELFDALWPGGQSVSDAALSQLIFRLRALLGPHGGLIATVRRGGVRLDAVVSAEPALRSGPDGAAAAATSAHAAGQEMAAAGMPPAQAAPATPLPGAAAAPRRRAWIATAVLLAAVAGAVAFWLGGNPAVSEGYALYADDLQASRADTPRLIAAAFAAADAGDRERAMALMRSLHEADPATPLPAALLAWWSSHGSPAESASWAAAARARLRPGSPPYLRLFIEYFLARSDTRSGAGFRATLDALLDLRPAAWYLQNTRAHQQLAGREFAGALHSLQQIPLHLPEAALLAEVLADRVSLGDPGAEALALRQPLISADPVLAAALRGRIAYSRGRLAEALAALDQASRAAGATGQYERQLMAQALAGLAAFELGSADLLPRLAATRRLCQERGRLDCAVEMLGLQAVLEARRGEAGRASALMAEAWQLNPHPWARPALLLLALQNELALPGDLEAVARDIGTGSAFAGVAELLRGWQALVRGDAALARRQLALAREQGVAQTYNAEDASLLGARLGEAAQPCRVDPPYPNVLRISACLRLRELKETKRYQ